MRVRQIRLKEYRKLMQELRKEYAEAYCDLTVYQRPISWTAVRNGIHRRYGCAYGMYKEGEGRAIVTFRGKVPRWQKLMVIAHELRHAQHVKLGLYRNYYRNKRPNVRTAFFAEYDCDSWAIDWLKKHGIIVDEQKARSMFYQDYDVFKPWFKGRMVV